MNWLADNMIVVSGSLAIIMAGLAAGWVKTGDKRLLLGALIPALLAVAVVGVGLLHESPQEQIKKTLFATAEAIEHDKVDEVVESLTPEREQLRERVRQSMTFFEIKDIDIKSNLKITMSDSGRRAEVEFNVTAVTSLKSGLAKNQKVAFFFIVSYVRDRDRWLIDDFEELSPEKGFQRKDARNRRSRIPPSLDQLP